MTNLQSKTQDLDTGDGGGHVDTETGEHHPGEHSINPGRKGSQVMDEI